MNRRNATAALRTAPLSNTDARTVCAFFLLSCHALTCPSSPSGRFNENKRWQTKNRTCKCSLSCCPPRRSTKSGRFNERKRRLQSNKVADTATFRPVFSLRRVGRSLYKAKHLLCVEGIQGHRSSFVECHKLLDDTHPSSLYVDERVVAVDAGAAAIKDV